MTNPASHAKIESTNPVLAVAPIKEETEMSGATNKITALYCRLSKDDMAQGDSESIKTQKAMLTQYAKEHGFMVVEVYVDDGFSGLNFERPDFNRMLDDIEAGKIDVVITKDLSRLGRDHLKVGHFTELHWTRA